MKYLKLKARIEELEQLVCSHDRLMKKQADIFTERQGRLKGVHAGEVAFFEAKIRTMQDKLKRELGKNRS